MRKELLALLQCPACKSTALQLRSDVETELEVLQGAVVCGGCASEWPVDDGIVDMLVDPPEVTRAEVSGRARFVEDTLRSKPMDDEWLVGLPESAFFVPAGKNRDFVDNLSELTALCGLGEGSRVLDIGAGNCWASWRLAAQGAQVAAVDVCRVKYEGLESGAVQIAGHGHYFERVLGEMENLPFADESVDACLFYATLHHSHDLRHALAESARVLRPGGVVLAVHEGVSGVLRNNKLLGIRSVHEVDWQQYNWNEQVFALHTYLGAARDAGLTPELVLPPFVERRLERREFDGLLFGPMARVAARAWRLPGGRSVLRSRAAICAASYLLGMPLTGMFRKAALQHELAA
jgi:SAM-dependent methyltransferase